MKHFLRGFAVAIVIASVGLWGYAKATVIDTHNDYIIDFADNAELQINDEEQFLMFSSPANWSSIHNGANYPEQANDFHVWWEEGRLGGSRRVEFECDTCELDFYIESGVGKDSWYGLQESSDHVWSFGQDASANNTLVFSQGFGLGTPRMALTKSGEVIFGNSNNPSAQFQVQRESVPNLHQSVGAHQDFLLESSNDSVLQIASNNLGVVGSAIILTNQQASNDGRHWAINHRGGSANNIFTLGYYKSTATGQNILTGVDDYFTMTTDGRAGFGATDPDGALQVVSQDTATSTIWAGDLNGKKGEFCVGDADGIGGTCFYGNNGQMFSYSK